MNLDNVAALVRAWYEWRILYASGVLEPTTYQDEARARSLALAIGNGAQAIRVKVVEDIS